MGARGCRSAAPVDSSSPVSWCDRRRCARRARLPLVCSRAEPLRRIDRALPSPAVAARCLCGLFSDGESVARPSCGAVVAGGSTILRLPRRTCALKASPPSRSCPLEPATRTSMLLLRRTGPPVGAGDCAPASRAADRRLGGVWLADGSSSFRSLSSGVPARDRERSYAEGCESPQRYARNTGRGEGARRCTLRAGGAGRQTSRQGNGLVSRQSRCGRTVRQ